MLCITVLLQYHCFQIYLTTGAVHNLAGKGYESSRTQGKSVGTTLSRRKEFCDFMQMMQPLDAEILKVL
jgi:hypothetical protein